MLPSDWPMPHVRAHGDARQSRTETTPTSTFIGRNRAALFNPANEVILYRVAYLGYGPIRYSRVGSAKTHSPYYPVYRVSVSPIHACPTVTSSHFRHVAVSGLVSGADTARKLAHFSSFSVSGDFCADTDFFANAIPFSVSS
jgi:hypothetical protein